MVSLIWHHKISMDQVIYQIIIIAVLHSSQDFQL